MKNGDVIGDRFVLGELVGTGGMGQVFRAIDRLTGGPVAVKVMELVLEDGVGRFVQEAQLLAGLSHPGIVRYVAHGETLSGQPYLVMEWLEGRTLSARLVEGALDPPDAFQVIRGVAEGLAIAHARGIVHRDIKPSNLFLVDGEPGRVKLLDFGVARPGDRTRVVTQTGEMLGTVGYMAPEQAMGGAAVDARADVFALGCVFYECLTGQPAFSGEHAVAVLAKVLYADPPRIGDRLPEASPALHDLFDKLLAKDRALRVTDAGAFVRALAEVDVPVTTPARRSRAPASITHAEQRIVSVIFVRPSPRGTGSPSEPTEAMELVAARFGAECAALTGFGHLFVLTGKAVPADQAMIAASCALSLAELDAVERVVLATGRASTTGRHPAGSAIDRAAALFRSTPNDHRARVLVDDVTANLVASRYDIRQDREAYVLVGTRADLGSPRLLLGKPTPCVGRDKEIAILESIATECAEESVARAVLVTGPAGIGKSRLCTEFLELSARGRNPTTIQARADRIQAGSSLSLVQRLVRNAAGLSDADSPEEQCNKVRARLAACAPRDQAGRLGDFLAELGGAPADVSKNPLLRACRDDARIMAAWMRRAFEEWLRAECSKGPLVVVLEDLHWGDAASAAYLAETFRRLSDQPLLVLAFARPELRQALPEAARGIAFHSLELGGLTRRPAERLVRLVLGDDAPAAVIARVVEQSGGNAFYLEELMRAVASGTTEVLPDTIMAMTEARLDGVPTEARRILRAGSIFGEQFSRSGVAALVGSAIPGGVLEGWLRTLTELEFVEPPRDFGAGDSESYAFRHGLIREAAYRTLPDADRRSGHRIAAEWLAEGGKENPLVVANHFERGGAPAQALPFRLRAAEAALTGGNPDLALAIVERDLSTAEAEVRGGFLEIRQIAATFRGDWTAALEAGEGAMALLPPGSTAWFRSAGSRIVSAIYLGKPAAVMDVLRVGAALPPPRPSGPFGLAMQLIISALLHAGARPLVVPFVERMTHAKEELDIDPVFLGWWHTVQATLHLFMHDSVGPAIAHGGTAARLFDDTADFVGRWIAELYTGIAHVEAGALEEAQGSLRQVAEQTENLLLPTANFAKYYLARIDALVGETESSSALLAGPPGVADGARGFLADVYFRQGDLERAEAEARLIESSSSCYARVTARSVLGRVALSRGNPVEALKLLDSAIADQDGGSGVPFWRSILLVSRAEALENGGDGAGARQAIRLARERVERIAAEFADERLRTSYLNLPAHHRTLELAEKCL